MTERDEWRLAGDLDHLEAQRQEEADRKMYADEERYSRIYDGDARYDLTEFGRKVAVQSAELVYVVGILTVLGTAMLAVAVLSGW